MSVNRLHCWALVSKPHVIIVRLGCMCLKGGSSSRTNRGTKDQPVPFAPTLPIPDAATPPLLRIAPLVAESDPARQAAGVGSRNVVRCERKRRLRRI